MIILLIKLLDRFLSIVKIILKLRVFKLVNLFNELKKSLITCLNYYFVATKSLLNKDFLPDKTSEVPVWSLATAIHLWHKVSRFDGQTFCEYLCYNQGVKIPQLMARYRFFSILILYLWPLLSILIIWKHKGQRLKQWRHAILRIDLYGSYPLVPFSEQAVMERRSDVFYAIFNAWDYSKYFSKDYAIDNKIVFQEKLTKAGLPTVPSFSFEEAKIHGGPYFVKDPNQDMGLGIERVKTFEELKKYTNKQDILIQPELNNHSKLINVLPERPPLCTLRLTTTSFISLVEPICNVAFFRIGAPDCIVDNIARGGILVSVDLETGKLLPGITFDISQGKNPNAIGINQAEGAKEPFAGIELPFYFEAVKLVKQAHLKIAPTLLSVGWDIAITDEGPILVEANIFSGSYEFLDFNNALETGSLAMLERFKKFKEEINASK